MSSILIVDDDPTTLAQLQHGLETSHHKVTTCEGDWNAGLELLRKEQFDLVVTDIVMPNMDGLEAIQIVHSEFPDLPLVAISGDSQQHQLLARAGELGVACVFAKPIKIQEFVETIEALLGNEK